MKNNKNSVLKPIVSIGFDKNGKIQSYVNADRIKQILGNGENAAGLVKEVEALRKHVVSVTPVVSKKTKLVDVKKSVTTVKASARGVRKPVLSGFQLDHTKRLIHDNKLLNAVKYVKETLDIGLKEAKEIVDNLVPVVKPIKTK